MSDLPRRDDEGEIPRRDEGAHAHRLTEGHVEPRILDGHRLPEDLVRRPAPVLEGVGHDPDLVPGVADRLPGVSGLEPRQVLQPLPNQRRGPEQHAPPDRGRGPRPGALVECPNRHVDRPPGVFRTGLGHFRHRGAGPRLDHPERPAVGGGPALPAQDQQLGGHRPSSDMGVRAGCERGAMIPALDPGCP